MFPLNTIKNITWEESKLKIKYVRNSALCACVDLSFVFAISLTVFRLIFPGLEKINETNACNCIIFRRICSNQMVKEKNVLMWWAIEAHCTWQHHFGLDCNEFNTSDSQAALFLRNLHRVRIQIVAPHRKDVTTICKETFGFSFIFFFFQQSVSVSYFFFFFVHECFA